MLTAGRMNERVAILTPAISRGAMGEQEVVYQTAFVLWANVAYNKGRQAITGGDVWMTTTIVITIRNIKAVTDRCRIRWDGKTYRITSLNRSVSDGSITITAEYIEEGTENEEG